MTANVWTSTFHMVLNLIVRGAFATGVDDLFFIDFSFVGFGSCDATFLVIGVSSYVIMTIPRQYIACRLRS